jgi:hypothetical protein
MREKRSLDEAATQAHSHSFAALSIPLNRSCGMNVTHGEQLQVPAYGLHRRSYIRNGSAYKESAKTVPVFCTHQLQVLQVNLYELMLCMPVLLFAQRSVRLHGQGPLSNDLTGASPTFSMTSVGVLPPYLLLSTAHDGKTVFRKGAHVASLQTCTQMSSGKG